MQQNLKFKGELIKIYPVEIKKNDYAIRKFVVLNINEKDERFNDKVVFQMSGAHCDTLDNQIVGTQVEVTFTLQGREWLDPKTNEYVYFNTLASWKIEAIGNYQQKNVQPPPPITDNNGDDLPF